MIARKRNEMPDQTRHMIGLTFLVRDDMSEGYVFGHPATIRALCDHIEHQEIKTTALQERLKESEE